MDNQQEQDVQKWIQSLAQELANQQELDWLLVESQREDRAFEAKIAES